MTEEIESAKPARTLRVTPDTMYLNMEYMIVSGEHPGVAGLSLIAHCVYMRLIAFCWKLGREEVPTGFLRVRVLMGALFVRNRSTFISVLSELRTHSLILGANLNEKSTEFDRIIVVGLADKIKNRAWKSYRKERKGSERKGTETPRRTRTETEAERAFREGFAGKYGHKPTIGKDHATKLAGKVGEHGIATVRTKISAWWNSPAGDWVKGNRTIGAFLHSFDNIETGNGSSPRPDLSRFDRAVQKRDPALCVGDSSDTAKAR